MNNKLYSIIKSIHNKYGKEHLITVASVRALSKFIKISEDMPEIYDVLNQEIDVNIDELKSLFNPDEYDFQSQQLGNIGVEKNED